jgi:hypothetical protein
MAGVLERGEMPRSRRRMERQSRMAAEKRQKVVAARGKRG